MKHTHFIFDFQLAINIMYLYYKFKCHRIVNTEVIQVNDEQKKKYLTE